MSSNTDIQVDSAAEVDIFAIFSLCDEFGFQASLSKIFERFKLIAKRTSHTIFVARRSSQVIGWIHAYEAPSLLSDRTVEIGGLIVSSQWRRCGVGSALMHAIEKWAIQRGFDEVLLATRVDRAVAQSFYGKLGYKFVHTTNFLNKKLNTCVRDGITSQSFSKEKE